MAALTLTVNPMVFFVTDSLFSSKSIFFVFLHIAPMTLQFSCDGRTTWNLVGVTVCRVCLCVSIVDCSSSSIWVFNVQILV